MGILDRGMAILESEISTITMSMKRGNLWSNTRGPQDSATESLLQAFLELRKTLQDTPNFGAMDPNTFLSPFLDVIRSEVITGPVTGLALSSVNKFLAYGLLYETQPNIANAVQNLAEAVTHARFVGVDTSSDEVVLMKILEVLRTLALTPVGILLTNECVCEIMQSTFRICFEGRLSDLLRKTAEHTLTDMIQLLFTRLPTFSEENLPLLKKLKMRSSQGEGGKSRKKHGRSKARSSKPKPDPLPITSPTASSTTSTTFSQPPVTTPLETNPSFSVDHDVLARSPIGSVVDLTNIQSDNESIGPESLPPTFNYDSESINTVSTYLGAPEEQGQVEDATSTTEEATNQEQSNDKESEAPVEIKVTSPKSSETVVENPDEASKQEETDGNKLSDSGLKPLSPSPAPSSDAEQNEFVNAQGITFTPTAESIDDSGRLIPYGLPCVRELFRFLVSLINPHDSHNQDSMIQIALSLIATALETGVEHMERFESLLTLVRDDLARNLVSLLQAERIGIFSSALWISFLMFSTPNLRLHLKYQLEVYLTRLVDLVGSENQRVTYEHKELSLEMVVRLYKVPGLITQLYLNFDCGMYTSNVFEDLTKMLSKNAFPVTGLYSTHFLSLDALLTVIEAIEKHCHRRMMNSAVEEEEKGEIKVPTEPEIEDKQTSALMNRSSGRMSGATVNTRLQDGPASTTPTVRGEKPKIPSHEELMALKHKKKLIISSTEQFNAKPAKGVSFMQDSGLIKSPMEPRELAVFLRENPHLDKKQLGDYISNRKNLNVLDAFVKSFDFVGLRIDEALRLFLETFRLPGEAPLITLIMEHFAEHWQRSSEDLLANADAAFTLAYAVIMLNVDQHNKNHTKTNDPMTVEQFMKNLRGTNDGADHDPEMLQEIYHAIRNEEIVMPAEQTGLVRENYIWKCVLKRGQEEHSEFLLTENGMFDHDLFSIIWGPTVAALSYVFDKSQEESIVEKALHGFQRCAMIAAHYHMSDVFDNLIISLCKFSTLMTNPDYPSQFVVQFGMNHKALLATRMVFALTHKHGDILRDGWKNVTECLLQLFKCQLLPKTLMEAEDYIEAGGRIKLYREEVQAAKVESGFLNSFVSFISMSSESQPKQRSPEEEDAAKMATKCIRDCNVESLVSDSKFLFVDSLQELVKYLISGSQLDDPFDEHAILFNLEFLVRITIQNRDRVLAIWQPVSDHIARLIMAATHIERYFMLERSVTALLRLSVRLVRKEELASIVVQSLQVLLAMKTPVIFHVARHVACGLYELLRNNAANIHESEDWAIIFSLIEVVGAGANPDVRTGRAAGEEDSGHGASSDSSSRNASPARERSGSAGSGGWIVLGSTKDDPSRIRFNQFSIVHHRQIIMHDSVAFLKCCESLAFLIRDVAHITPHNFHNCVQAVRTFVEASFRGANTARPAETKTSQSQTKRTPANRAPPIRRVRSAPNNFSDYDADESDNEDLSTEYQHVAMQLLDLMHTLHIRAAEIYSTWAEEGVEAPPTEDGSLWTIAWCPLLQGTARLCCDKRTQVRTAALTTLQRALLFQDLQNLTPVEWEKAFTCVLFPMLGHLLRSTSPEERTSMEETRTRAATLLGKVFLQHLTPLTQLSTFSALWLTILDFMEKFIKIATSDLLADAVPESLKNMLLVMDTAGIFYTADGQALPLWNLTWEKLETFLPHLMSDLFGKKDRTVNAVSAATAGPTVPAGQPLAAGSPTEESQPEQPVAANDQPSIPTVVGDATVIPEPPNTEEAPVDASQVQDQQPSVEPTSQVASVSPPVQHEVQGPPMQVPPPQAPSVQAQPIQAPPVPAPPVQVQPMPVPPAQPPTQPGPPQALQAQPPQAPPVPPLPPQPSMDSSGALPSPVEPPVMSSAMFRHRTEESTFAPPKEAPPPKFTPTLPPMPPSSILASGHTVPRSANIPPPPTFGPGIQPPPGIASLTQFTPPNMNMFQPIQTTPATSQGVPVAAPKPIQGTQLSSYFPGSTQSNLLATGFTPTLPSTSNPVILGAGTNLPNLPVFSSQKTDKQKN